VSRFQRQHKNIAACILLSSLAFGAHSETTPERLAVARQLVDTMGYKKMYDDALKVCLESEGSLFDPAVALETAPDLFQGITPQSAYWPEVQAAYRRFQVRTCNYLSAEEFTQYMAQQYAERNSLDDLRYALTVYSAPAGRRLQKATLEINNAYQVFANETMHKATIEAGKQSQQEVLAIVEKYLKEPR
jgi:hypothetical protein